MKTFRLTLVLLTMLALVIILGASTVAAAGTPVGAPYVDAKTTTIAGNTSQWYLFNYVGDHSQMTITLPRGAANNQTFAVYTPEQVASWWDAEPLGRGAARGDDLVWTGNSHVNGTYAIKVTNGNVYPISFQLQVVGDGVSFGTAGGVAGPAAPAPIAQPAAAPATFGPTNRDPGQALALPVQGQGIPPNTSLWYNFGFSGGDDALTKITLTNGAYNNLQFEIYSPGQMAKWWEAEPVGRGAASGDDLFWAGDLHLTGTYYVRVINNNSHGVGFALKTENVLH